jgi:hypothetical protein
MTLRSCSKKSLLQRLLLCVLVLLTCAEPLLNAHFNAAGWEDEPGFRIRLAGQALQAEFHEDVAATQDLSAGQQEATVFVPPSMDSADALGDWLASSLILSMVLAMACLPRLYRVYSAACQPGARWFCHWHAPPWINNLGASAFPAQYIPTPTAPPTALA